MNWGEIYYNTMREVSQEAAEQQARAIATLPMDIVGVGGDLTIARQAAIYKATHKMSYSDCFAAALTKLKEIRTPHRRPGVQGSGKGNQNPVAGPLACNSA